MRKYLFTLAALLAVVLNSSFYAPVGSVTVEITNLNSSKGHVLISLYNNEDDFPENAAKAAGKAKVAITKGKATVTFDNLPYGKYAAAILHDADDNLKMNFNIVGMPKEGYGFSNNAKGTLGPPSFSKAAFELNSAQKKISIKTTYFL